MLKRSMRDGVCCAIGLACALIYFLSFAHHGLSMWMSNDDLMNIQFLHGWNRVGLGRLTLDSMLVASPAYRPFAGIVYRLMFAAFGLNPFPYRLLCFALLTLNLGLAARLFYLLNPHLASTALATLIFSFHTCLAALYFESSTIYDLLCFTFGIAAVLVYVSRRQRLTDVWGWPLAAFLALYCLALDSKEMAISLPLTLAVYEVVYHWREPAGRRSGLNRWRLSRWLGIGIAAVVTLAFGIVKVKVPSAMSINPLYQPRISPAFVLEQLRHYYSQLLWEAPVSLPWLLLSLAALLALAAALRSRPMLFGFFFANIALIPVSVIPGRDGFVWYLPYLGWTLYIASALILIVDHLLSRQAWRIALRPNAYGAVYGLVLAALIGIQLNPAKTFSARFEQDQLPLKQLLETARRELPHLRPGARVLVADDYFEGVAWQPLFLFRLAYRDPTLWVDRPAHVMDGFYDPADLSIYDAVIHAKNTPIRVLPAHAQAETPSISLKVNVNQQSSGDRSLTVESAAANCVVDIEAYLPDDVLQRLAIVRNWCTLDSAGRCVVPLNPDAQRGVLKRIRFCHRSWETTNPAGIYLNQRY